MAAADLGSGRGATLAYSRRGWGSGDTRGVSSVNDTLPATQATLAASPMTTEVSVRPPTRFEHLAKLGRGGMAVVDLARDVELARDVAVKKSLGMPGREDTALFLREARITASLEHPNIVPVHDIRFAEDGTPELVMKAVEGRSLADIIDALRRRDPEAVREYTLERRLEVIVGVLRALAFAHRKGVLHRDIKPDNIMVGQYGEVLLLDWGIARAEGEPDVSAEGNLVGTPAYMSPEQARGEALDARSDLFSVAVVLHELLHLRHYLGPELTDPMQIAVFVAEQGGPWSLPQWHRPGIEPMPPLELYHFLRRAMAHDRDQRFADTDEMLTKLLRILDGHISVQCHITFVKASVRKAGRLVDRYPWVSFGAFALGIALMGTGVVSVARSLIG